MAERVIVDLEENVAKTAKDLATNMWYASGRSEPTIENQGEFLRLVASCAQALKGVAAYLPK